MNKFPKSEQRGNGELRQAESYWHLDKRVPIALILAIFLQVVTALWWAASIDGRVQYLEASTMPKADIMERLVGVETVSKGNAATLGRVEAKLDRVIERARDRE